MEFQRNYGPVPRTDGELTKKQVALAAIAVTVGVSIPVRIGYMVANAQERTIGPSGNETLGCRGSRAFVGVAAGSFVVLIMAMPLLLR